MSIISLTTSTAEQVDDLFESLNRMTSLLADIQYNHIYDAPLVARNKCEALAIRVDKFIGEAKVLKARIAKVRKATNAAVEKSREDE